MAYSNRVSLDTDVIFLRTIFAFSTNNVPVSTNYVMAAGCNGQIVATDALRTLETYGIGYLPSTFSTFGGQIISVGQTILSTGVTTDMLISTQNFLLNNINYVQNEVEQLSSYVLENVIPSSFSTVNEEIALLNSSFAGYVIAQAVTPVQLLSTTGGLTTYTNNVTGALSTSLNGRINNVSNFFTTNYTSLNTFSTFSSGMNAAFGVVNSNLSSINLTYNALSNYTKLNFETLSTSVENLIDIIFAASTQITDPLLTIGKMSTLQNVLFGSNIAVSSVASTIYFRGGNVGINTSNPTARLDVSGATNLAGNLNVNTNTLFVNAATGRVGIANTSPAFELDVAGTGRMASMIAGLSIDTTNHTLYVDDVSQLIGVRTTTPAYNLDVNGTINFTGGIFNNGVPFTSGGSVNVLGTLSTTNVVYFGSNIVASTINLGSGTFFGSNGRVGINTLTPNVQLDVSGATSISGNLAVDTNTLFVNAATNSVGIATTTPTAPLDVAGLTRTTDLSVTATMSMPNGTLYANDGIGSVGINTTTPSVQLDISGAVNITNNLVVDTNTLFVNAANNRVGIATASPNYALDVAGTAGAADLVVTTTITMPQNTLTVNDINRTVGINTNTITAGNSLDVSGNANVRGNLVAARIGAGTSAPTAPLDVSGAAAISGNLAVNTNTLYVDAATSRVGIGLAAPTSALDVSGVTTLRGNLVVDTNTLYVDASTNRVGIATTAPGFPLDVAGTSRTTDLIVTATMAMPNGTFYANDGAGAVGINTTTPSVQLDVSGAVNITGNLVVDTNTLYVDSSTNNVGIANATPSVPLDVSGSANVTGNLIASRVGIATASPSVQLDVSGAANITGNLVVDTNTLFVNAANNRVGVGTVAPAHPLDVVGLTRTTDLLVTATMNMAGDTLYANAGVGAVGINTATPSVQLDVSGAVNITNNLVVDTNTLFVNAATNRVGIVNAAPAYSLDVTGDINFTGTLRQNGNPFSGGGGGGTANVLGALSVANQVYFGSNITLSTMNLGSGTLFGSNTRVGINTLTPSVALDVSGATNVSGNLAVDTNTLFVNATTNRVGIVNAAPAYPLDVVGDLNFTGLLRQNGVPFGGGGSTINVLGTLSTTDVVYFGSNIIASTINIGPNTFFASNGRVGINCNAPSVPLDVSGVANISGNLLATRIGVGTAAPSVPLDVSGVANVSGNLLATRIGVGTAAPSVPLDVSGATNISGNLAVRTNTLFVNAANGRVGIGTVAPTTLLDVAGETRTTDLSVTATMSMPNGTFYANDSIGAVGINTTTPSVQLDVSGAANVSGNLVVDTDTLFVDAATNRVGIVNAAPAYPLDVVGDLNFTGLLRQNGVPFGGGGSTINVLGTLSTTDVVYFGSNIVASTMNLGSGTLFGSNGRVGINCNAPTAQLDVSGAVNITNNLVVDTNTLFVNAANNRVGVGTAAPTTLLDVAGQTQTTDLSVTATMSMPNGTFYASDGARAVGINTVTPSVQLDVSGAVNITNNLVVDTNTLFVNAATNRVGIVNAAPSYPLDVTGDINFTGTLRQNGNPFSGAGSVNVLGTLSTTNQVFFGSNITLSTMNLGSGTLFGSNGRVGINTTTPNVALDVNGSANITGNLAIDTNTLFVNAATNRVGVGTAAPGFPLDVAGTTRTTDLFVTTTMYMQNNTLYANDGIGAVGINTATPSVQLDVSGAASISGNLVVDTNTLFVNAATNRVGIVNAAPTYPLDVIGDVNFSGILRQNGVPFGAGGSTINVLGTLSTTNVVFFGSNIVASTINIGPSTFFASNSRVGINCNAPSVPLDVSGAANVSGNLVATRVGVATAAPSVPLDVSGAANVSGNLVATRVGVAKAAPSVPLDVSGAANISGNLVTSRIGVGIAAPSVPLDVSGAANISGNLAVRTNALFVNAANGRVGIGTVAPTTLLDISGQTRTTDLSVTATMSMPNGTFYANDGVGAVGINTTTPSVQLDVSGAAKISGNLAVDTNTLFVNAATNRVGIVNATPAYPLDITGDLNFTGTLRQNGVPFTSGASINVLGTLSTTNQVFFGSNIVASTINIGPSTFFASNGRIGINCNAPTAQLDISGTANITGGLVVDTNTLFVNAANNRVGVGTATPAHPLDVVGLTRTTDLIVTTTMNMTNDTLYANAGVGAVGINTATPSVQLDVSGAVNITNNLVVDTNTLFVNAATNRVGIVNAAPVYPLDVTGDINFTGILRQNGNPFSGGGSANVLGILSVANQVYFGSNIVASTMNLGSGTLFGSNGRVGINCNAPSVQLDVSGAANITGGLVVDANTLFVNAATNRVGIATLSPTALFDVNGAANIGGNLAVNGFIGIGTTSPTTNLDVIGSANILDDMAVRRNLDVTCNLVVDTNTLFVNATTNRVGIINAAPAYPLDVVGDLNFTGLLRQNGVPFGGGGSTINVLGTLSTTNVVFFGSNIVASTINIGPSTLFGSNGRVGINCNAPSVQLDVSGAANVNGNFVATRIGVAKTPSVPLDVSGAANVSGNLVATRIGVGTAAPSVPLDVSGAANVSGNLTVDTNTLFVNAATNRVGIVNGAPSYPLDVTGDLNFTGTLRQNGVPFTSGTSVNVLGTLSTTNQVFFGSNIVASTINIGTNTFFASNGRVGINCNAPTVQLDVSGAVNITNNLVVDTNTLFVNAATNRVGIATAAPAHPLDVAGLTRTTDLLVTAGMNMTNNTLYANAGVGAVGINTATPSVQLDVSGAVNISGTTTIAGNLAVDTDILYVDTATNFVGIGTTAPLIEGEITKMDVNGSMFVNDKIICGGDAILGGNSLTVGNADITGNLAVNTNTLFVNAATNRVGIVNGAPSYPLDVTGDLNFTGTLRQNGVPFTSGTSVNVLGTLSTTNQVFFGSNIVASTINIGTNTFFASNGSVGINCNAPSAQLDVSGAVNITGGLVVDTTAFVVDVSNNRVGVNRVPAYTLDVAGTINASNFRAITTFNMPNSSLYASDVTRRVGVNTASPSVQLDVSGTTRISGNLEVDTNILYVDATTNRVGIVNGAPVYPLDVAGDVNFTGTLRQNGVPFGAGGSTINVLGTLSTTNQVFFGSNIVASTMNLGSGTLFGSNGRVGINTTAPTVALDVSGAANITGNFTVDTNTLFVNALTNRVGVLCNSPSYTFDVNGNTNVNGRIFTQNGTAGAPAFCSVNDIGQDTGIYFPADGQMSVTNNGIEYCRFTTAGVYTFCNLIQAVGFGSNKTITLEPGNTAAADTALTVRTTYTDSANGAAQIALQSPSLAIRQFITPATGAGFLQNNAYQIYAYPTGGATNLALTIDPSGRVGIRGNTIANIALNVNGDMNVSGRVYSGNGTASSPAFGSLTDVDSGLFFPADGQVSIATNNDERYRFTPGIMYSISNSIQTVGFTSNKLITINPGLNSPDGTGIAIKNNYTNTANGTPYFEMETPTLKMTQFLVPQTGTGYAKNDAFATYMYPPGGAVNLAYLIDASGQMGIQANTIPNTSLTVGGGVNVGTNLSTTILNVSTVANFVSTPKQGAVGTNFAYISTTTVTTSQTNVQFVTIPTDVFSKYSLVNLSFNVYSQNVSFDYGGPNWVTLRLDTTSITGGNTFTILPPGSFQLTSDSFNYYMVLNRDFKRTDTNVRLTIATTSGNTSVIYLTYLSLTGIY